MGFSDQYLAQLWNMTEDDLFTLRKQAHIFPIYKMIDTCAGEFESYVPYFYSTYEQEEESVVTDREKIIVLGSGPIRIGQGVEFDYSTVHALRTIRQAGYEAIVINNNPETVSTDYTTADKLYFEPLTIESVMNVVEHEKPKGVIVSLGGQTAVNLAEPLARRGVPIIGTDCDAIEKAENRDVFENLILSLTSPTRWARLSPTSTRAFGWLRKSAILYWCAPALCWAAGPWRLWPTRTCSATTLRTATRYLRVKPVLVDKYVTGKEVEVDAICDGKEVFVPGIMELVERTGVHSGDSISVYPPFSLSQKVKDTITDYTKKLGIGTGIVGLFNIQFIVDKDENVYIIEVNPRASRSVPFLSKSTGCSLVEIAVKAMLGHSLQEQADALELPERTPRWYVKAPAFSFSKLGGMDTYLSPEMKSTGEAIGYDTRLNRALYKALQASGIRMKDYGTVLVTLADEDKEEALPLVKRFYRLGFNIEATAGTAAFLKKHGIRTRVLGKISEGSDAIPRSIRAGYVSYIINTRSLLSGPHADDGAYIRRCAVENGVTAFTSLDTVRILLDVLEEIVPSVDTIDCQ